MKEVMKGRAEGTGRRNEAAYRVKSPYTAYQPAKHLPQRHRRLIAVLISSSADLGHYSRWRDSRRLSLKSLMKAENKAIPATIFAASNAESANQRRLRRACGGDVMLEGRPVHRQRRPAGHLCGIQPCVNSIERMARGSRDNQAIASSAIIAGITEQS